MIKKIIAGLAILTILSLMVIPAGLPQVSGGIVEAQEQAEEPVTPTVAPMVILVRIVQLAPVILILVAVLSIIFGAFMFATASGDDKKLEQGRKAILFALIAVIIGVISWGAVIWVRDWLLS